MLVIQCKEPTYKFIQDVMAPLIPQIVEESGGYIDCFDKDWIFIILNIKADGILGRMFNEFLDETTHPILIGLTDECSLIQRYISESEQHVFIRYNSDWNRYQILHGFKSYIIFGLESTKNPEEEK